MKKVIETKIEGGNKGGSPRKTWNDWVKEEAKKRSISWKGIRKMAKNVMTLNSTHLTHHNRKAYD